MTTTQHHRRARRLAGALVLAAAGVSTGCGAGDPPQSVPETEASPAQPAQTPGDQATVAYTGAYDENFRTEAASYAGQQVTLSGEVADLVPSRSALVLADPENPEVDPLLVSARYTFSEVEEGAVVEVTGTVREDFTAPVVEEAVEGDEESGFYDRHLGQPYLDEAEVSATEPAEQ